MSTNTANFSNAGLRIGDKLEKFEIVEQIGAGGFSVVWKGYDRLLDQTVAIKQVTFDAGADVEAIRERFRTEAELQKKVSRSDEHLVSIIDFVEDPRGLFIVMEYVDGPSLEHMLAQNPGPVDAKTALGIAAATAVGLNAIHKQNIVHRDLKPANILLPKGGGLRICDFGLATLMQDQDTPSAGTVRYMAPELLSGGQVDQRADLYSLGFILYECLVGRENFDDAFKVVLRDQRNQAMRWMKWHTNQRVKAPPITQYAKDCPPVVAELVDRLLAKDPGQRIGSAEQLLEAMRRQLSGKQQAAPQAGAAAATAHATPDAAGDKTAAVPKRNKLLYIGVATVAVWITAALIYFGIQKSETKEEVQEARQATLDDFQFVSAASDNLYYGEDLDEIEWQRISPDGKSLGAETTTLNQPIDWQRVRDQLENLYSEKRDHLGMEVKVDGNTVPLGKAIIAHGKFAKAMIAFEDRDYAEALETLEEVDKLGVIDFDKVNKKKKEILAAQSVDNAEVNIRRLLDAGRFFEADNEYQTFRRTSGGLFSPGQRERWDTLGQEIAARQATQEVDELLAKAQKELEENEAGAMGMLQQWLDENPNHPGASRPRQLLETLQARNRLQYTIADGEAAEARQDYATAISKYQQVIEMSAGKARELGLTDKIQKLRGRVSLAEGKTAFEAGDYEAAIEPLNEALAYDPTLTEAKQILGKIGAQAQLASLRRDAEKAFADKEYTKAINYWKRLRDDFGEDADQIAAKIEQAELKILEQTLDERLSEDDYAGALATSVDILKRWPEHKRATSIKFQVETMKQYDAKVAKAEERFKRGDYGGAKLDLRKAREIAQSIEDALVQDRLYNKANDRLTEVEYIDAMTKAKRDHSLDKLDTAKAWAAAAIRTRTTDEAKALYAKIQLRIAELALKAGELDKAEIAADEAKKYGASRDADRMLEKIAAKRAER